MEATIKGRYLVTGSTGFIGKQLCQFLAEHGAEVYALVRSVKKASDLTHPNITIIQGDLHDKKALLQGMEHCRGVFHLAAFARVWSHEPGYFEKINFEGTQNVLDMAQQQGVERVVVTSTAGVMGPSGEGLTAETDESPENLMTQYEKSKLKSEKAIQDRVRNQKQDIVIVNPTRVFGPGPLSESNGEVLILDKYLRGKFRFLPGDGSSSGSYAYIDDVVMGHWLAMKKGRAGERYILGGENASFKRYFAIISKQSGVSYKLFGVPTPLLLAFANIQVFLAKIFKINPLITPELARKFTKKWNFSTDKAKEELGYAPRSLEQAVADTLAWWKETHGNKE